MASPGLKKYGAPDPGSTISDSSAHWKLAQKVEKTMKTAINEDPKQINPRELLVAPANRDGVRPNVQYVHYGILRSLAKSGFDKARPQVGICIQFRSAEGKQKLLDYNKAFSSGNTMLPPIEQDKALYGTLAGTHLNLALRLIQSGIPSPACDVTKIVEPGTSLEDVVYNGHRWWILPEDTPVPEQVQVSLWRNMDQNENQSLHEVEILRTIISSAQDIMKTRSKLILGEIVSRASSRSPARISEKALQSICQYYMRILDNKQPSLAQELQEFHSARINPRELQMSAAFFATVANEKELRACPLLRHYLVTTNYTPEKARASVGHADICMFLECAAIQSLGKKPDLIKMLENLIRDAREKYIPVLCKDMSEAAARLEIVDLVDLWIRCAFARQFKTSGPAKAASTGKLSEARARQLAVLWAQSVDQRFPDLQFSSVVQLQEDPSEQKQKKGGDPALQESIDVEGLLTEDGSLHPGDLSCEAPSSFNSGDRVALVSRITVNIHLDSNPKYRKDIDRGTVGVVQDYADPEHRAALVRFKVKVPDPEGDKTIKKEITAKVSVRNLIHESELQKERQFQVDTEEAQKSGNSNTLGKSPKLPAKWSFLNEHLEEDDITEVKPELKWPKLLDTSSTIQQLWFVKGKVAAITAALLDSLPEYGTQDIMVVNRKKSDQNSWKCEVWTMRAFSARELVIPILSSELKDCYWTKHLHSFVSLPKHGSGRHPEGKQLAFDGRGHSRLGQSGIFGDEETRGHLCWVIERDTSGNRWNLQCEPVSAELTIGLKIPGGKKRKATLSMSDSDLPSIPVLVNPKAIKVHTRLWVKAD